MGRGIQKKIFVYLVTLPIFLWLWPKRGKGGGRKEMRNRKKEDERGKLRGLGLRGLRRGNLEG